MAETLAGHVSQVVRGGHAEEELHLRSRETHRHLLRERENGAVVLQLTRVVLHAVHVGTHSQIACREVALARESTCRRRQMHC